MEGDARLRGHVNGVHFRRELAVGLHQFDDEQALAAVVLDGLLVAELVGAAASDVRDGTAADVEEAVGGSVGPIYRCCS